MSKYNDDVEDEICTDHDLCGYLCVVLQLPNNFTETPSLGTPCDLFNECGAASVGFKSQNGVVMSPITNGNEEPETAKIGGRRRRNLRIVGLVHGSMSVVNQLHVLTASNCVKVKARVICVDDGRAIVLVDIYLPVAVWSGWQFPQSAKVAAALFKHLSCNWEERNLMLCGSGNEVKERFNKSEVWNVSDCHVLGCKLCCGVQDLSSKKRQFDLDEIFKSIPSSVTIKERVGDFYSLKPANGDDSSRSTGIWNLVDDILKEKILNTLGPKDLVRVAATCRHLRSLTASIMPCMKLELFEHQQAAVEWMLQRERNTQPLAHPLYKVFSSKDGFAFYVNAISGDIVTGIAPTVRDFRGGMFCDEPGLGKTITALSLILKTQGKIADPPDGVQAVWSNQRCGYYELSGENFTGNTDTRKLRKRIFSENNFLEDDFKSISPKRARLVDSPEKVGGSNKSSLLDRRKNSVAVCSEPTTSETRHMTRSASRIQKTLFQESLEESDSDEEWSVEKNSGTRNHGINVSSEKQGISKSNSLEKCGNRNTTEDFVENDNWVQCDACHKWRKVLDASVGDAAWFCSMNTDPARKSCRDPEESFENCESITHLLGFCPRGSSGEKEENISFFISVLKEKYATMRPVTKNALYWLANLSPDELSKMGTVGLPVPGHVTATYLSPCDFYKTFQAFGLVNRVEKRITKWYYPKKLNNNLVFDSAALRKALGERLDSTRLYLSKATLIVVPANLVDHWETQVHKHVRRDQLQIFVWTENKKPLVHSLAWDYDIVITTFTRLSAEWSKPEKSALSKVHWLRIILDEGHTLGGSFSLTNKLQMVVSMTASNRWILTGTPTPNTPNSQLSHLKPMLKFLHEEVYGLDQKSWEAGIVKPFEAEMEEGRSLLLQLLRRSMIMARKSDLKNIPQCIKKVTLINFGVEHARTYNELVETVQRNILLADWKDPSHVESLLNPKQFKFRSTTTKNIRLSCCVAGHIKVANAANDIQETMDLLIENGLEPKTEKYVMIEYNLLNGGNCLRCNVWCRLPIITPCQHLLCLDCISLDSEKCTLPGCGNLYEMESPETLARPENPNPKWPVPKDLIELQPSYKQDDWNPDWESTSSSKVTYLVERLKALQETNVKNGDLDVKQKLEMNDSSALLQQDCFRLPNQSKKELPEKVIIFSQFLEHINVIEQQLTIAGIKSAPMYSPRPLCIKVRSLAKFKHDDSCLVLLMDGSAALGLDLSFVNHVFLMEPIWDRSMEEQVISRAHRMGAKRTINVETLVMRGTIEEQMVKFLQDTSECRRFLKDEIGKSDQEGTRTQRTVHEFAENNYLARLSFVRTSSEA